MSSTQPTRASVIIARLTLVLAAVAIATIDLTAKAVAETRLADSSVDLGPLELRLGYNPGVAFGLGDALPTTAVLAATAAITLALAAYGWRQAARVGPATRIAAAAVIGGAAANVIDRATDNVVTDYLHTGWWPTFNLADTFIVTGLLALALLHTRPGRSPDQPPAHDNEATQDAA